MKMRFTKNTFRSSDRKFPFGRLFEGESRKPSSEAEWCSVIGQNQGFRGESQIPGGRRSLNSSYGMPPGETGRGVPQAA